MPLYYPWLDYALYSLLGLLCLVAVLTLAGLAFTDDPQ